MVKKLSIPIFFFFLFEQLQCFLYSISPGANYFDLSDNHAFIDQVKGSRQVVEIANTLEIIRILYTPKNTCQVTTSNVQQTGRHIS